MSNSPKTIAAEELEDGNSIAENGFTAPFRSIGTHLAFRLHGVRVGLELSVCIFLYGAMTQTIIPLPEALVSPQLLRPEVQRLIGWFVACLAVATIDQLFFVRAYRSYRASWKLELEGRYEEALSVLERIAPESPTPIPLPRSLYHLRRAMIYTHSERFSHATEELSRAFATDVPRVDYYVARSELFRYRNDYESAKGELQLARYVLGSHPVLNFEGALILFEERDMRGARKKLEEVLSLPSAPHPCGEHTYLLGRAFWEATRLWTGEAEEGFDGLTNILHNLMVNAHEIDSLRPVVALLLCERAYYLVTHREPKAAVVDAHIALRLCQFPHIQRRYAKIEEERCWRYPD